MALPPLSNFVGKTTQLPPLDTFTAQNNTPPATTPAPTQPHPLNEVITHLTNASKAITDFMGLHNAIDTTGTNLANTFDTGAMQKADMPLTTLGENISAGTQIGLATAPVGGEGNIAKTVGGRIAKNAGIGAIVGGANAASSGGNIPLGVGTGAAFGAVTQGLGEGVQGALSALPNRLTRSILPKLAPGTEAQALANTKLGTIGSLLNDSNASVNNLGSQIRTILSHPDYITHTGEGNAAIQTAVAAFPHSNYTAKSVISAASNVVPAKAALVDKVAAGTATLAEKNTLRQALDAATKSRFTDTPKLSASKEVAGQLADALRKEVQSNAPETKPVFQKLSHELNLRNALASTNKKLQNKPFIGLLDIISALGGGLPAVAGEKFARSPAIGLGTAKAATQLNKAMPTINKIANTARSATIKKATNQ